MTKIRYYGTGSIPGFAANELPGRLIVLEGTDGVGRSTQVALLHEWLEANGYAVAQTGLARSSLVGPGLTRAKQGHTLGDITLNLFYATDFADRLEKEIVPALKAGFVVLADRYIFSALARAAVRGVDRAWLRSLYGFAVVPHLVFYLKLDPDTLTRRVLKKGGMDFWESGMDLKLGDDIYDNFRAYQGKLLREYNNLAEEFGFRVIDARQPIDAIQTELRRQLGAFLSAPETPQGRDTAPRPPGSGA